MKRETIEYSYRKYVTDSLHLSSQNMYIKDKWSDLLNPPPDIDADEVVNDIIGRAGLIVK